MTCCNYIIRFWIVDFFFDTARNMFFVALTILVIYFAEAYLTLGSFIAVIIVLSTLIGFADTLIQTNCQCSLDGSKVEPMQEAEPDLYQLLKETEQKTGFRFDHARIIKDSSSSHSNASVEGVCISIVNVEEPLLEHLPENDMRICIIYHEIAHRIKKHIPI